MDFGYYGSLGLGSASWPEDRGDTTHTWNIHRLHEHYSFGIVLDDYPGADNRVNYHLTLGFHRFGNFRGLLFSNAFGYVTYPAPTTRFWIGPEVRLEMVEQYRRSGLHNGLGLGPAAGINWEMGRDASFGLAAGYQYLSFDDRWFWNAGHRITERLFYINIEILSQVQL